MRESLMYQWFFESCGIRHAAYCIQSASRAANLNRAQKSDG
jgi:hypothetical protein